MKSKLLITSLAISVLINVTVIPKMLSEIVTWRMMYRSSVDYAAELAYAVGFHRAKGHDLSTELDGFPTRLQITKVTSTGVEAVLWPAKHQSIRLDFDDTAICNVSIVE